MCEIARKAGSFRILALVVAAALFLSLIFAMPAQAMGEEQYAELYEKLGLTEEELLDLTEEELAALLLAFNEELGADCEALTDLIGICGIKPTLSSVEQNPEAAEPEAAEPGATEPEATEPEATEPEATEPEAVVSEETVDTKEAEETEVSQGAEESNEEEESEETEKENTPEEDDCSKDKDEDKDEDKDKDKARFIVSFPSDKNYKVRVLRGGEKVNDGAFEVNKGERMTFRVELSEGYSDEDLTVKANGEELVAKNGVYRLSRIKEDIVISISLAIKYEKFSLYDSDTKIRVSGEAAGTPSLNAVKLSKNSSAYKKLLQNVKERDVLGAYRLSICGDTQGDFTITFTVGSKYNGERITILRVRSSGKVEELKATVKNGKASIKVGYLSSYMLLGPVEKNDAGNDDTAKAPSTGGEPAGDYGAALIALSAMLAAICSRVRKRQTD